MFLSTKHYQVQYKQQGSYISLHNSGEGVRVHQHKPNTTFAPVSSLPITFLIILNMIFFIFGVNQTQKAKMQSEVKVNLLLRLAAFLMD